MCTSLNLSKPATLFGLCHHPRLLLFFGIALTWLRAAYQNGNSDFLFPVDMSSVV